MGERTTVGTQQQPDQHNNNADTRSLHTYYAPSHTRYVPPRTCYTPQCPHFHPHTPLRPKRRAHFENQRSHVTTTRHVHFHATTRVEQNSPPRYVPPALRGNMGTPQRSQPPS